MAPPPSDTWWCTAGREGDSSQQQPCEASQRQLFSPVVASSGRDSCFPFPSFYARRSGAAAAVLGNGAHPQLTSHPTIRVFFVPPLSPHTDSEMQAAQCFVNMSCATAPVGIRHCPCSAVLQRALNARWCSVNARGAHAYRCTWMRDGGPLRTSAVEVFRQTVSHIVSLAVF